MLVEWLEIDAITGVDVARVKRLVSSARPGANPITVETMVSAAPSGRDESLLEDLRQASLQAATGRTPTGCERLPGLYSLKVVARGSLTAGASGDGVLRWEM